MTCYTLSVYPIYQKRFFRSPCKKQVPIKDIQMTEINIQLTKYAIASSGLLKIDRIGAGIGVILYSAQHKIGAGLHILASHSGYNTPKNPIMYANTAIPFIMNQLSTRGVRPPISIAIAGGAVMLGTHGPIKVGPKIVKAVKEALAKEGLTIKIDETEKSKIRSMVLDIDAGKIKIS